MSLKKFDWKKIFQGKKVYFSGSIRGSNHLSPKIYNDLIYFMKERGADVLTEFVGASDLEKRTKFFWSGGDNRFLTNKLKQ